jgi:Tol biopolymer transport system component
MCALLLAAVSADAQYFGRNKVQYQRFEFRVLETPHFNLHYYDDEADAAQLAARLAERWYERLSVLFDHAFSERQPIILYASQAHFSATSVLPGSLPEGVGGFTDHRAGRVVLPFGAGLGDTDHVLGHELVHAFQRDILKRRGQPLATLPLWFAEGMAEQLSIRQLDAHTRMWLRDAVASDHLPTLAQLDDPKWFPYRYGQALWAFVVERYGEGVVRRALATRGTAVHRLEVATGSAADVLTREWHAYIRATVGPIGTRRGDKIIVGGPGRLNLAPALSPDGRTLVYLSERDRYSVVVFAADASTGATIRKLFTAATDAHVDRVQFIDSSGSWASDGRSFVFATVSAGAPLLTIFDMPSGDIREQIPVPEVDQIFSPSWSPDGTRIAFSAIKGGLSDLYVLRVADRTLRALTTDAYSDLQPAWAPDGRRIAFTSDRFSSSLDALTFGPYEIATIDVASNAIEYVGGLAGGKNVNPQWTPSGDCLYFVSDASGTSNVYRVDLSSRDFTRVTDDPIGVSGIAPLSPAISVGAAGTQLASTVYTNDQYRIVATDLNDSGSTKVTNLQQLSRTTTIAVDPAADLFTSRPYRSRLSLFTLGQPYMTAGGGPFGTFMRAGVSLTLGDLIGQQQLQSAIQIGKGASDFALQTTYINRGSRWNWGITGSHVPWVVGGGIQTREATNSSGESVLLQEAVLDEQRHRQLAALAVYPFSRARRIETSVGIDSIAFTRRFTQTQFNPDTGRQIGDITSSESSQGTTTSLIAGAAFVHDTSVFGLTAPVLGERYRVSLGTSLGGLSVTTAAADYRRYFAPVSPMTVALRLQQLARWGGDIADSRVLPLVWRPRDLVRGFPRDAITLHASRVSSINAELRAPLAALARTTQRRLPIDLFGFTDWGRFDGAGERELWSVGAGARLNAAGFIFEFNGVHPMHSDERWRIEVNFRPGF